MAAPLQLCNSIEYGIKFNMNLNISDSLWHWNLDHHQTIFVHNSHGWLVEYFLKVAQHDISQITAKWIDLIIFDEVDIEIHIFSSIVQIYHDVRDSANNENSNPQTPGFNRAEQAMHI